MSTKKFGLQAAVTVVTAVGCVPTLSAIDKPAWVAPVLIVALLALVAVALFSEYSAWRELRPKLYPTADKIRDFMYEWIGKEGRVTIYTRDMSWAQQEERIRVRLREKATNSELVICLPQHIPLTCELETLGATVHTFDYHPSARFTIVRTGREDAQVAIGRNLDGDHAISVYSAGRDSAFALAEDLVDVITRASAIAPR